MRHQNWVIYTSSYDRGLEHLLKIWPDVIKEVPDAELHIFYGWMLFDKFYRDNPGSMAWKTKMLNMMDYKGITDHGRVSQIELKGWYEQCGIWAYPTHFGEISCISAMKAQAWGAVPVVIDYAALQTTVQFGSKIGGDIYDKETKEEYKKALIEMLNPEKQEKIREPMMIWARGKFAWSSVAQQWIDEFSQDKLKDAMDVLLKEDKELAKLLPVQLQEKYAIPTTY